MVVNYTQERANREMKKLYYKFFEWMLETSSPCKNIIVNISERFDRKLSISERLRLHTHMKFCHCCTRYKKQMDNLHNAINTKMQMVLKTEEFDEKLPDNASIRIKDALRQQLNK
jgi:hypothetical protein